MLANRMRLPVTTNLVTLSSRRLVRRPATISPWRRYASTEPNAPQGSSSSSSWFRNTLGLAGTGAAAFFVYSVATNWGGEVEPPKTKDISKLTGDLGSQFVQKKKSLKSPGVFLWGSNAYRVVDPESKETVIKAPRNIPYFEGQVLRDLKIDEKFGAAINEKGDLVQWGKGFSETDFKPTKTLTGKNLISLCTSQDRILALSSDSKVYSLPIAKADQEAGRKARESSWLPFGSGKAAISYRLIQPSLGLSEKITSISGGLEHALLLTSSGRVFSVVSSTESYPSFGQLGIPGLTWETRPSGPVDACHEITALKGTKIAQIATGDHHSLALSKDGRVFAFGNNSFGQLGVEFDASMISSDTPMVVPLLKVYRNKTWLPKVTSIAAGGANSFFTVDSQRVLGPEEDASKVNDLGQILADTWTCGRGIWGALGNGKWTHLQDSPTLVKSLSGLTEYDEKTNKVTPIRLRNISVGTTHVSAVMDNQTHVNPKPTESLDKAEDWGFDVLYWGGNEEFQLGTGKRSNMSRPTYINAPIDSKQKGNKEEARLQIMPRHNGKAGDRTVSMEQRVECGKHISAIYSAV